MYTHSVYNHIYYNIYIYIVTYIIIHFYIVQYAALGLSNFHLTPWQTCSIEYRLNFSGKHPARLQLFVHKVMHLEQCSRFDATLDDE